MREYLGVLLDNACIMNALGENIVWNLTQASFFTEDAQEKPTQDRSRYYKAALYNKLEHIRVQRNRVHLQVLREKDHKYTKRDVEYALSAVEDLTDLTDLLSS